jgi:hypothetical protein
VPLGFDVEDCLAWSWPIKIEHDELYAGDAASKLLKGVQRSETCQIFHLAVQDPRIFLMCVCNVRVLGAMPPAFWMRSATFRATWALLSSSGIVSGYMALMAFFTLVKSPRRCSKAAVFLTCEVLTPHVECRAFGDQPSRALTMYLLSSSAEIHRTRCPQLRDVPA